MTCPWPVSTTCLPDDWAEFDPAVWNFAVLQASATLHALSAYRVGGCPITVRPGKTGQDCLPAYGLYGPQGPLYSPGITLAGLWVNSCGCESSCGHGISCSVTLPAPVGQVTSVKVDGEEQTLSDFRVDNGNVLVYQGDSECPFDSNQDLRLPDTEVGTWSVTYLNSFVPDQLAQQAVAQLAYEFALSCLDKTALNGRKCRLPSNVTALTRTGVTMEFTTGVWPDGLTGIRDIDAWLATVNPSGRKSQTRVYSPDVCEPHIQGPTVGVSTWDGGSPYDGGSEVDGGTP